MTIKRASTPPKTVRRIMQKHGLPEPTARAVAALAYGEIASND